jgi:hypothetical protein
VALSLHGQLHDNFRIASIPLSKYSSGIHIMLFTIAIILLVLWLLGLVSSYTMGGFIHILLVVAIVIVLVRIIQGRNL